MSELPRIHLGRALSGSDGERAEEIERLRCACEDVGFFVLVGHGVLRPLFEDVFRLSRAFFSRPLEEKNCCRPERGPTLPDDPYTPYGYSGLLEENAFAYMGLAGRPSDYVEKMSAGRLILREDPRIPFPSDDEGRELKAAFKAYFDACLKVSRGVLVALERSLGLAPGFFVGKTSRSNDSLRSQLYPALGPGFDNDQGMGFHTDGTVITMLAQTEPGIEVCTRDGRWIRPRTDGPDEWIVNIGDLLSHWSGGRYVSTPHQVTLGKAERQSLIFFKLTDEDEHVREGDKQMDALLGRA